MSLLVIKLIFLNVIKVSMMLSVVKKDSTGYQHNRFCGPAAVSIVSGISTGAAAKLLRSLTGKKQIRGVNPYHYLMVLKALGFVLFKEEKWSRGRGWTLADVIDEIKEKDLRGTFVISVYEHVLVIERNRLADSILNEGVDLDDFDDNHPQADYIKYLLRQYVKLAYDVRVCGDVSFDDANAECVAWHDKSMGRIRKVLGYE